MSVDLEFAIKQDIRNNPVVREVDTEQKREFLQLLAVAAAIVVMLLIALWPRFSNQENGYQLEDLRQELARERALQRKYVLELETLLRPELIERRAIGELGMIAPSERDTLVLGRVPSSPRPTSAIVAAAR